MYFPLTYMIKTPFHNRLWLWFPAFTKQSKQIAEEENNKVTCFLLNTELITMLKVDSNKVIRYSLFIYASNFPNNKTKCLLQSFRTFEVFKFIPTELNLFSFLLVVKQFNWKDVNKKINNKYKSSSIATDAVFSGHFGTQFVYCNSSSFCLTINWIWPFIHQLCGRKLINSVAVAVFPRTYRGKNHLQSLT